MDREQTFGAWLKKAREEAGVSQRGLADALGVAQPVISRMENGLRVKINRSEAAQIATALGIPYTEVCAAAGIGGSVLREYPVSYTVPNPEIEALSEKLASLSVDDQRMVREMIERLLPRPELPD